MGIESIARLGMDVAGLTRELMIIIGSKRLKARSSYSSRLVRNVFQLLQLPTTS
jgi:hypothetical protein